MGEDVDAGCTKFITLFKIVYDGPISPNPADTDAVEFVSLAKIAHERASGMRAFTPTFLHLLDFYLQSPSP